MDGMDARTSRRGIPVALIVALALAACGSGEAGDGGDGAAEPMPSADEGAEPDEAPADESAEPDEAPAPADAPASAAVDVSGVDWATVV